MNQLWWATARAGGIVSYVLLVASVVLGLFLSTRVRPMKAKPVWTTDLHRFLGGLATIFVFVHITGIVFDSYVHFGLTEVLLPLASSWHPTGVALGIIGLYLLLAVELTSLARRRLPKKLWHAVHISSIPLFGLATLHFATTGTDAGNPFAIGGMMLSVAAVGALLYRRFGSDPTPARPAVRTIPRSSSGSRAPAASNAAVAPTRTRIGAGSRNA